MIQRRSRMRLASLVLAVTTLFAACSSDSPSSSAGDDDDGGSNNAAICMDQLRAQGIDVDDPKALDAITQCTLMRNQADSADDTPTTDSKYTALYTELSLSVPQACDEFFHVIETLGLTDEETATAFFSVANRTIEPNLAAAIRDVGTGFQNHDVAISSTPVASQCPKS